LESGTFQAPSRLQCEPNQSCWESANLAAPLQTELAIDTNVRVADTQTMVADTRTTITNTQTIVADTQMTVTNTQTMVADAQIAVTDTQTMVADTKMTVSNTQTMVADMHRNMLTGQKGTSGQNDLVSATRSINTKC
jgi:hypothetical protein